MQWLALNVKIPPQMIALLLGMLLNVVVLLLLVHLVRIVDTSVRELYVRDLIASGNELLNVSQGSAW